MKIQVLVWLIANFAVIVSAGQHIHVASIARHSVGFESIELHGVDSGAHDAIAARHAEAHV